MLLKVTENEKFFKDHLTLYIYIYIYIGIVPKFCFPSIFMI